MPEDEVKSMGPTKDPDVIFATPSFAFKLEPIYKRSIVQTEWLCNRHGISTGHMERNGDCFVAKARSKLVTDFLQQFKETQHFFFLDDDIGWPAAKVVEFLMRPESILCGAYPKKSKEVDFPVTLAAQDGKLVRNENGAYLCTLAPSGFMRIHRHVLEHLAQACDTFTDLEPDGKIHAFHNIFEAGRSDDGRFWGEDYTFCKKAQKLGYDIWCDANIDFQHSGHYTWENNLMDHVGKFENVARDLFAKQQRGEPANPEGANYPRDREPVAEAAE